MRTALSKLAVSGPLLDSIADCRPRLIRLARCLVGPTDAEDLVQSTIERAIRHSSGFQSGTNLHAWLRRIMSNLMVDEWRRPALARGQVPLASPSSSDEAEESPRWLGLSGEDVRDAVATLPSSFRTVFELHCYVGLSYAEIARRLDIAIGTVGTRLHRARRLVRAVLTTLLVRREDARSSNVIPIDAARAEPPLGSFVNLRAGKQPWPRSAQSFSRR